MNAVSMTRNLPTRLLEIVKLHSSSELYFRLRISSSLAGVPEYVTLSHCWGQGVVFQLKQSSLLQLQEELVCVTELSATFKQAIEVSWHLGFRYLWIDSLCIIQDSLEDWQNEAAKMMDVYSNSQCTLAATASSDGREGLSRPRNIHLIRPYIKIPTSNGILVYGFVNISAFEREILHSPLNRRAWVLQERLLAPRTLHFSDIQIWWTCKEAILSESYARQSDVAQQISGDHKRFKNGTDTFDYLSSRGPPDMLLEADGMGDYISWSEWMSRPTSKQNVPGFAPPTPFFEIWDDIVYRYTRTSLTYTSDKAIAIGGLARLFQRRLGDSNRYIAGLWRDSWITQIMWSSFDPSESVKSDRVPSWSWLSVDGAINMHTRHENKQIPTATLVRTDIVPVTEDPFGLLEKAVIWILGPLFRVNVTITADWDIECQIEGKVCQANVFLDADPEEDGPLGADLHFLVLFQELSLPWYQGLLLRPCRDSQGYFQRIGCIYRAEGEVIAVSNVECSIATDPDLTCQAQRDGGKRMVSIV